MQPEIDSRQLAEALLYGRGEVVSFPITVRDDLGALVNLTGLVIQFTLATRPGSQAFLLTKTVGQGITILDQSNPLTLGMFTFDMAFGDTTGANAARFVAERPYWWCAKILDPYDQTVGCGPFVVSELGQSSVQ